MTSTWTVAHRLPHRYPMLLVDRVVTAVPGSEIVALKAVTTNEPWYAEVSGDARDGDLAYPAVLLMESWAQSAGILAASRSSDGDPLSGDVMLFGGATEVRFLHPVLPGDVLEHRVRVVRLLSDTMIFEGECLVAGRPVMTVERMVMAFRPAQTLRPAPSTTSDSGSPAGTQED
ncbi:beta-hydroxyacyl-ACP dehydratase [Planosporangium thailandense]|uniref:Beta-hydroxyacyl-ACP dehydratase n=1 Tax=Planosporangium thailandense TaxID=765197 RepID=A0ABX0XX83_9ACTN|nr:3-hydroxyacyl-ACP dehydratase FabZ family protein [Planosporangium thailandense]NJC70664.1 beta-hydroxyacyl-ACP dehydratase [Planosporangium thailandense]